MEGKYGKPTLITSRITIDYEKDTVDIEKPEPSREERRFINQVYDDIFTFSFGGIPIYLIAFLMCVFLLLLFFYICSIIILFLFIFPIFIYIFFYNKKDIYFEFFAKNEYKYHVYSDGRWRTEVTKLDEPIYEIALFHNIYLEYNAEGEFSKYLRRIEIREQTFIKESFSRFRHKKKEREGIGYWKATFYFKDVPKTGKLTVWLI